MLSDGYVDQFGGDDEKKFMTKRFKHFILDIQSETMENQKTVFNRAIDEWRGEAEQLDDILVMGIRM